RRRGGPLSAFGWRATRRTLLRATPARARSAARSRSGAHQFLRLGFLAADAEHAAHALFGGHAPQCVRHLESGLLVRDEDELRARLGQPVHEAAEAPDVGLVQRCVYLVQHRHWSATAVGLIAHEREEE